jgi:hypothetical protein
MEGSVWEDEHNTGTQAERFGIGKPATQETGD